MTQLAWVCVHDHLGGAASHAARCCGAVRITSHITHVPAEVLPAGTLVEGGPYPGIGRRDMARAAGVRAHDRAQCPAPECRAAESISYDAGRLEVGARAVTLRVDGWSVDVADDHSCGTACAVELPRHRDARGARFMVTRELHARCGTPLYVLPAGPARREQIGGLAHRMQTYIVWCVTCDTFERRDWGQCEACHLFVQSLSYDRYCEHRVMCHRCDEREDAASAVQHTRHEWREADARGCVAHVAQAGRRRGRRYFRGVGDVDRLRALVALEGE